VDNRVRVDSGPRSSSVGSKKYDTIMDEELVELKTVFSKENIIGSMIKVICRTVLAKRKRDTISAYAMYDLVNVFNFCVSPCSEKTVYHSDIGKEAFALKRAIIANSLERALHDGCGTIDDTIEYSDGDRAIGDDKIRRPFWLDKVRTHNERSRESFLNISHLMKGCDRKEGVMGPNDTILQDKESYKRRTQIQ